MATPDPRIVDAVFRTIERTGRRKPLVVGICGAQGSGKSTLAREVLRRGEAQGTAAAILSIDDLYLTRSEREALAREIHPLLRTRGAPGTHDVALGLDVFAALDRGEPAMLPRFDKAADEPLPRERWEAAPADCELLIFEGWCVGARPQTWSDLAEPVNDLEAREDPDGLWRRYANDALAGPYQPLFARIDALVLLAAPGFEVVFDWRLQQEAELIQANPDAQGAMGPDGIARFVQHYERLTRHILAEMPGRADLVVRLGADRAPLSISPGSAASR